MTRLRDDIRSGFDRQQSGLGEIGDARHRLMRDAMAAREVASHRVQWAAGIAAVLIAAILIATFALVRGNIRPQTVPGTTPRANASPTPLRNPVNVPDSTPLILFHDPEDFDQLDGMTWDGTVAGRVGAGALNGAWANSAGSSYGSMTGIWDRHGHHADAIAGLIGKGFNATWADDQVHYCGMVPSRLPTQGGPAILEIATPGGASRQVTQVATIHSEMATYVAACSVQLDRAVVVQSAGAAIGTAIDAQLRFTGEPKIAWDVYSGLGFRMDSCPPPGRYAIFAVNVVEPKTTRPFSTAAVDPIGPPATTRPLRTSTSAACEGSGVASRMRVSSVLPRGSASVTRASTWAPCAMVAVDVIRGGGRSVPVTSPRAWIRA